MYAAMKIHRMTKLVMFFIFPILNSSVHIPLLVHLLSFIDLYNTLIKKIIIQKYRQLLT